MYFLKTRRGKKLSILVSQLIVVLINTYIAFTERKKNIYIVTFLFNFANLVMYLFNNDKTTAIIYVVISVRSLVYIFKDIIINKLGRLSIAVPILCIVVQLLVGFTQIESLWQLIPILTPCYVCYYLWFYDTTQKLRVGNIIGNALWFFYNCITGLYIVAVSRLVTVAVNIVSFSLNKRGVSSKKLKE